MSTNIAKYLVVGPQFRELAGRQHWLRGTVHSEPRITCHRFVRPSRLSVPSVRPVRPSVRASVRRPVPVSRWRYVGRCPEHRRLPVYAAGRAALSARVDRTARRRTSKNGPVWISVGYWRETIPQPSVGGDSALCAAKSARMPGNEHEQSHNPAWLW